MWQTTQKGSEEEELLRAHAALLTDGSAIASASALDALGVAARRRYVRGMVASPIHSCHSVGAWTRTHVFNPVLYAVAPPGAPSAGSALERSRLFSGGEWWEATWTWESACPLQKRRHARALANGDGGRGRGRGHGGSRRGGMPRSERGGALSRHHQPSESPLQTHRRELFDGSEFLPSHHSSSSSSTKLRSVHFIGESHLALIVDCFAAGHERAEHLEAATWQTLHRMEVPPVGHAYDGALAKAAGSQEVQAALRHWASCSARPMGCWSVWNATLKRYNEKGESGLESFRRRCWAWKEGKLLGGKAPLVCKHEVTGLFRAAMTLRLMIYDQHTKYLNDKAKGAWTSSDVLVVQGGTWDSMCEGEMSAHFEHDVPAFLKALRELRTSPATRNARVIYLNLNAHAADQPTTGWRNSWAQAAANRYVQRALQKRADFYRVRVVDQLAQTWPRHEAAPDSNHWVRRRFSHDSKNYAASAKPRGPRAMTFPPKRAFCIGDAGMAIARALRDEIESGVAPW